MDRILLWGVQSRGQWRSISTELSPERHNGWPYHQLGSPCQDPAGNRTTRRRPDHRKETQTAVAWSRLPFIRSGQNHLARHSERGKKTRQTEEGMGRQHQGMDRPGVRQVLESSGEQRKMRKLVAKSSVVPQDLRGYGIDDNEGDDDDFILFSFSQSVCVRMESVSFCLNCREKIGTGLTECVLNKRSQNTKFH